MGKHSLTFFFIALLGACKKDKSASTSISTPPVAAAESRHILKIPITDASTAKTPGMIGLWLEELIRPRAQSITGIEGSCSTQDRNTVVLSFKNPNLTCADLASENDTPAGMQLECLSDGRLRVTLPGTPCVSAAKSTEMALDRLRLPLGKGFYLSPNPEGLLEPNTAMLPSLAGTLYPILRVSKSDPDLKYRVPEFQDWLLANSEEGMVSLELVLDSKFSPSENQKNQMMNHLRILVSKMKAPKLFFPRLASFEGASINSASAIRASSTVTAVDRVNGVFFMLPDEYESNSPYDKACGYVRAWLHAEQLLDKSARGRQVLLNCRFRIVEDEVYEPGLTLTRLPLPLVSSENGTFPIKTYEESRSMTVLQGMMR